MKQIQKESEKMKAAVVCANEDVQYLDYEEPTPGPGEVKVKVKRSEEHTSELQSLYS